MKKKVRMGLIYFHNKLEVLPYFIKCVEIYVKHFNLLRLNMKKFICFLIFISLDSRLLHATRDFSRFIIFHSFTFQDLFELWDTEWEKILIKKIKKGMRKIISFWHSTTVNSFRLNCIKNMNLSARLKCDMYSIKFFIDTFYRSHTTHGVCIC